MRQNRPAFIQILRQRRSGRPTKERGTLFAALAGHPNLPSLEIRRAQGQRSKFADAKTGRIGRLNDRHVAQGEGFLQNRLRRAGHRPTPNDSRLGGAGRRPPTVSARGLDQPLGLRNRQHFGEAARLPGSCHCRQRIPSSQPLASCKPVEGPKRCQALCHGALAVPFSKHAQVRAQLRT